MLFQLDDERQLAFEEEANYRLEAVQAQERDAKLGARNDEISALESQDNEVQTALAFAKSERTRWDSLVQQGLASVSRKNKVDNEYEAALGRVKAIEANIRLAKLGARSEQINTAQANRKAAESALEQAQWALDQRQIMARVGARVEEIFYQQGEYVTPSSAVLALLPDRALKVRFLCLNRNFRN
ncbi:MAG: HlyD family secretion protein [Lentisphaeria bacterium]